MRNLLKFLAIILLVSGLSCSVKAIVSQDGGGGGGGTGGTSGGGSKLESILIKIKDTLKTLGYIVCVIFIMWGGYLMIMSQGDPKQFERGKTALLYALIGLVVILIADNIVNFIQQQFQQ
jgi:formate hydrogenlyase subunit 3/multisubunit Na+/H+ antiporter MnhD subunit